MKHGIKPGVSLPERHGVHLNQSRRIASSLLWFIQDRDAAEPSAAEWQSLGEALTQGDPLADAVAAWLASEAGRGGWSKIESALMHSGEAAGEIDDEAAGELNSELNGELHDKPSKSASSDSAEIHALLHATQTLPDWVVPEKLDRACEVIARSGRTGMRVLRDFGLMAGYQASAINQTLVRTGALEKGAARRVAETTKWWMDCTEPGALLPGQAGWRGTLKVRLIHAMVRRQLRLRKDWDHDYLGLPVNQLDMQVTYLAFSVMFLLGQRLLGTPVSQQEADAVMHLWRYNAWLMGVDERLLVDDEQAGRIALYRNLLSQATADETSAQLGRALLDEPLGRHYPDSIRIGALSLPWRGQWSARWHRQVHLSIVRFFVGREGCKALGLPSSALPWFPLIFAPTNFLVQAVARVIPGGKSWLVQRGRRVQQMQLQIMFGDAKASLLKVGEPSSS